MRLGQNGGRGDRNSTTRRASVVTTRWERADVPRGATYDERFERLAASGHDVHGEASFVMGFGPTTVLDAGCGTGRVAIELARRGCSVVGADIDKAMLRAAYRKARDLRWVLVDLSELDLRLDDGERERFDVVACAGNVMIFLAPGTEGPTVERLADHVAAGGVLISGFQLQKGGYDLHQYDEQCEAAGLTLDQRYSSWDRQPWRGVGGYAVSVHRSPVAETAVNSDPPTTEP